MKDSETKCEYCEKIHPDWFACSKYVELIVRSAPINAAPPETKCKCNNLQNGDIIRTDDDGKCIVCGFQYLRATPPETTTVPSLPHEPVVTDKNISVGVGCNPPPETSSWSEQLAELINDHVGGRIDSVHIHNFVRNLASSEYKRGVEDSIEKASEIVHGGGAKEEVIPAIKTLIKYNL